VIKFIRRAQPNAASSPAPAVEIPVAQPSLREHQLQDLLRRWMSLASVQQRVIDTLCSEVSDTSSTVERESNALSARFQEIATASQCQAERVGDLTAMANAIELAGEKVPMSEIASLLAQVLDDVVSKIVFLSSNAMSTVYALETVKQAVEEVEKCTSRIDAVTKLTNMLALNAKIEAVRAGEAGRSFAVVADEVKELSKTTRALAETMHAEIGSIVTSVHESHSSLQQVATMDMSANMLAKDRLDHLVSALVQRDGTMGANIDAAAADATRLTGSIAAIVTGMQFQDRAKQRLEHVVDTLTVIREAAHELQAESVAVAPQLASEPLAADLDWLKRLAARITLGEIRSRFVARVIEGNSGTEAVSGESAKTSNAAGSIELF